MVHNSPVVDRCESESYVGKTSCDAVHEYFGRCIFCSLVTILWREWGVRSTDWRTLCISSPPDSLGDDIMFSWYPPAEFVRTSPKWPILCRLGRKTLTQSVNRPERHILLPRFLMTYGLSNLHETYRVYSLAPTGDLVRFWKSKVKLTAGRRGGE